MIDSTRKANPSVALFLILACTFLVYSNSLYGKWIFDDSDHILERPELHLEKLTPQNIAKTFFEHENGDRHLYRPVSSFTLGLNWFFGEDNPRGYHVVNLLIHLLATVLLFKIINRLLYLLNYKGDILLVSGIAAFLWAVHPIQTQAVSYIVQRMAALAAMFYLAGIYFYLNFKTDRHKKWLAASLTMFLLAVFSKENAVLFPLAIVMVECLLEDRRQWKKYILPGAIVLVVVAVAFLLIFKARILGVLDEYYNKPFTFEQRVLTEPRVIWFYIYQLFMVPPDSFGFNNPFTLSKNLFQPLTTFFSIAGIFAIVLLSAHWLAGKRKLLKLTGFSFLFFFVHHLVESTVLPLALYYEHRNYLPSVFVFIPVGLILAYVIERYKFSLIKWMVLIAMVAAMIAAGLTTYNRNFVWQSPITFWKDAMKNDPESFRPYLNLAYAYDPLSGDFVKKNRNKAIVLYKTALTKQCRDRITSKRLALSNLTSHWIHEKAYKKAIIYLKSYIRYSNLKNFRVPLEIFKRLSFCYLKDKNFEKTLAVAKQGDAGYPKNIELARIKGRTLLVTGKVKEGLSVYEKAVVDSKKNYSLIWRDYGVALGYCDYKDRGLWFLKRYYRHNSSVVKSLFFIANNLVAQEKPDQAAVYIDRLLNQTSFSHLKKMTEKMDDKSSIYYLLLDKGEMKETIYQRIVSDYRHKTDQKKNPFDR